jgi:hypothetical protein
MMDHRAAEKQASRDQDAADLASGRKSREQLWRENSFIPEELAKAPIDFTRIGPVC